VGNLKSNRRISFVELNLTLENILKDIEGFKDRIYKAQQKLSALPKNVTGYRERKKIRFKRKTLEQEIEHVKRLILIARDALEEMGQGV
jgi:hypothetical protein